ASPSAVECHVGESLRLDIWFKHAWIDIQSSTRDWSFMWAESTAANTVADTAQYALPIDYRSVIADSFVFNGKYLPFMDFYEFRKSYKLLSATGLPAVFTVTPNNGKIEFYPIPDAAYSFQYDYFKIPQVMSANTDTPALASHYHQAIVWLALKFYGEYEQDVDIVSVGNSEYSRQMTAICNEFLPDMKLGEALA
ncbi:MAG: hypothetical protein PF495_11775, partial [Spirochaetales bacterium]|nr:hypothetical protein [Spirochaetales bacterium]